MLFNSYIFIFLFLPLVIAGWYGLNHFKQYTIANLYLVCMSLWFYAYFNIHYLWIILISCFLNYFFSFLFDQISLRFHRIILTIIAICFNLGLLGYYKYYNFFMENINILFRKDNVLLEIVLPLGISFFTLQQLSFILDRANKKATHYKLLEYLAFVTFFPQLVAGPIVLHNEFIPQFLDYSKRTLRWESICDGCIYFVIGLGKKVLLADKLAILVNQAYNQRSDFTTLSAILFFVLFAFELYLDFSGYSDIAIGIGKIFQIDLPFNFESPFKSSSMQEFWRRWHITLSRFFTTYVYIPLGGNRKEIPRKYLNILIVFFLSGLWHGASWNFIIWGILNGVGVIFSTKKITTRNIFCTLGTFFYFSFTLIFFRSETFFDAIAVIKGLFRFDMGQHLVQILQSFETSELYMFKKAVDLVAPSYTSYVSVVGSILLISISIFALTRKNTRQIVATTRYSLWFAFGLSILFVWSVLSFSGVSTFLYFNF